MAAFKTEKQVIALVTTSLSSVISYLLHVKSIILLHRLRRLQIDSMNLYCLLRQNNYKIQKLRRKRERRLLRKKRSCWYQSGRTDLWWQNILTGISPPESWKKNFRLNNYLFNELVNLLRPFLSPNPMSPNYRAIPIEKRIALTLYYLKDTGSLGMTANSFGVAICTASKVIAEVCEAITKVIGPQYIYLPKSEQEMKSKVAEFESKFGMTQAFGCIDGTHIPIQRPLVNSQDYFCYKQFFSLSVQAICDYRGYFMDVDCRWPGSVHDAKVFANSSINMKLRNNRLPKCFQTPVQGLDKVPNYLIGDPAYPLVPFCMKEYERCTSDAEVIFNNMLRAARNPIECAFGRLKARWSILTRTIDLKLEVVPFVVYACFVLHNLCEFHNSYIDEELVRKQQEHIAKNEREHKNTPDPIYSINEAEGEVTRTVLTKLISNNI